MKFLINNSTDPYFNMAFDEHCLREYNCDEPFFYLWRNRPSVIIGMNQNAYGEVNLSYIDSQDILLVRRVTGGGAVYHDLQNLNYSIIGKDVSPEPIVESLKKLGVAAELSGRNDIFVDNRKVSGYARRVWHDKELVHGTLMFDVDITTLTEALNVTGSKMQTKGIASVRSRVANLKEFLPQYKSVLEFRDALQVLLAGNDEQIHLSDEDTDAIQRLTEEKFATWEWIYGNSKEANLIRGDKLACGSVTAEINLDRGYIKDLHFSGDFIGARDASEIENKLKGVRFELNSILRTLETCDVPSVFEGCQAEEIAKLMINYGEE